MSTPAGQGREDAGPAEGRGRWLGAEQGADDSGAMLGAVSEVVQVLE